MTLEFALAAIFFLIFATQFLPVDRISNKLLELSISRTLATLLLILLIMGITLYIMGIAALIYLSLTFFSVWAFCFAFLSDRRYIYILALIFLGLCPFFLIIKLESIAEFSAMFAYLCLVMGVTKDILYEKITGN